MVSSEFTRFVNTRRIVALLGMAILVLFTACSRRGPESERDAAENRYRVVTTIGMITDIVERVAGDRAQVQGLVSPGTDPHLYRPTRSDIAALMNADIVFYNGLLLEGKMTDTLVRVASSGKPVHAVTELIDESELIEPEGYEGHADPHVWMDPLAWMKAVEVVRDALIAFDPGGADVYRLNAADVVAQIQHVHDYAERVLASVPESARILISAHDAFGYFGRRYGFEVVGIQGISTDSEAGVRHIESLVRMIVERDVGAVFVESTVAERNVEALVAGVRARGKTVRIGGELFSDAMGRRGTYEGTYVGMIDHNVSTIARALGGVVPPGGANGRLVAIP